MKLIRDNNKAQLNYLSNYITFITWFSGEGIECPVCFKKRVRISNHLLFIHKWSLEKRREFNKLYHEKTGQSIYSIEYKRTTLKCPYPGCKSNCRDLQRHLKYSHKMKPSDIDQFLRELPPDTLKSINDYLNKSVQNAKSTNIQLVKSEYVDSSENFNNCNNENEDQAMNFSSGWVDESMTDVGTDNPLLNKKIKKEVVSFCSEENFANHKSFDDFEGNSNIFSIL